ncbi:EamA family transporter [Neptuniibacter sp. 1_MG-2023]|uniref:EamA family transporter n=1 Tax=Neptuniibacter sp. 1_MG-2023 TaxID=3062662 RepID=UPI0026E30E2B|nr:EamA family transporter [Neptuniibacter sp. 1_MG-2023]MDO6593712.1 EamA family transporter [Neptuniibacter sp. 1_MG-2023]
MSWLAVSLVIFSALLHASWNLLGKKVSPTVAFFSLAFLAGTLPLTPIVLPFVWDQGAVLFHLLPLLLLSGFCQAIYCSALALSYAEGAMSVAYPLARSIPVMLVAVISSVLGMQALLSLEAYIGVFLVLLGAVLLPMQHLRDFKVGNYFSRCMLLALLAASATAGYSIADKIAIDQLADHLPQSGLIVAVIYIWLEGIAACIFLFTVQLVRADDRHKLKTVLASQKKSIALTGAMITLTYLLVLWAMQLSENISAIVALRQVSIPIGALLGVLLFKEQLGWVKSVALILLCAGVFLILSPV